MRGRMLYDGCVVCVETLMCEGLNISLVLFRCIVSCSSNLL